ncbi:hypothetical protein [Candidatus Poriferisocius sp.]|uniref:hypothetical protein n=1 Tax=Candidatus Poriferisocius sp. TaxID=3101276 RepID=UPI003B5C25D3
MTFVFGASIGSILMVQRVDDRASARSFRPATASEAADLSGGVIYDSIDGEQITVNYWRIESPGATIAGLPGEPFRGQWYVSPALAGRLQGDPVLGERYGNARVVANDGVGSVEELFAHRVVGPGVPLPHRYVDAPGPEWSGLNAGVSVTAVGFGAFVVVGLTGGGLLLAALGPMGVGLARRMQLLRVLGAGRAQLWAISGVSGVVMALPGVVIGGVGWYLAASRLRRVPLVGQPVLAGDLSVPVWLLVTASAVVVVMTAALGAGRWGQQVAGVRPGARIPLPSSYWRLAPLIASLGLMVLATTRSGSGAVRMLLTGLLLGAVGVVVALPVLVFWLGRLVARGRSVLALLVGRRMSFEALGSARPLLSLAAAGVLVPVAASYIAVARTQDEPIDTGPISALSIRGELATAEMDKLARHAGGAFAEVFVALPDPGDFSEPRWHVVADCRSIAAVAPLDRCGPTQLALTGSAQSVLAQYHGGGTVAPEGASFDHRLFLSSDLERAESVIRSFVVNSERADLQVTSAADLLAKEARSVRWIIAALKLTAAGAIAALVLSLITTSLRSAGTRLRLFGIGADTGLVRKLVGAESAIAVAVMGLTGVAIGTVGAVAYALVDGTVSPNYTPSLLVAAVTLLAALVAGVAGSALVTEESARKSLRTLD